MFLGLKCSIPGILGVGKFGKYFFGGFYLSKDFLGVPNNLKIFRIYQMRERQLQMV